MRVSEVGLWVLAALAAVAAIAAAVAGFDITELVLIVLFLVVFMIIGQLMATDLDRSWLPYLVLAGFIAKIVGAGLRYGVYRFVYISQGDAGIYHGTGSQLAEVWRNFNIPSIQGTRGSGTRFVEVMTGLLYAPHTPDLLGGFLIFAMLGFGGQLLFYAAFRQALPDARLKLYAMFVLFLPGLVFWPSSIGKDAVMLLFLGLAAYGSARLFDRYSFRWIPVVALGVLGAAAIRAHVAALAVGALAGAALLAKTPKAGGARFRKWAMMGVAGLGVALLVGMSAARVGLDLDDLQLDPVLNELERRTAQGGSAVEGSPIQSLGDVPQAVLRVVFRPLVFEGFTPLALASGIEGTALLVLIVWKLPTMIRSARSMRQSRYLMFSALYVAGFIVVFSPVLNLGILARQRTQVLPLLLALLVALGWPPPRERDVEKRARSVPALNQKAAES